MTAAQHQITDFLGRSWTFTCMGCAISSGQLEPPGGLLHQTPHFYLHQDPLIPLTSFLVIASKRHIQSITDMSDEEYSDFATLLRAARQALTQIPEIEQITIVQEERSRHFHLWLFPWTAGLIHQYGPPSLTKIRQIMRDQQKRGVTTAEWQAIQEANQTIKTYTQNPQIALNLRHTES